MIGGLRADAAQLVHERHADPPEMRWIVHPRQFAWRPPAKKSLIEWLLRHCSHCYADFTKLTRITIDPGVCTGKPCIRGAQVPTSHSYS
jgi:hypothetical protein